MSETEDAHLRYAVEGIEPFSELITVDELPNIAGLVALVRSVARLAVDRPDLAELDLNPVVCTATGPVAVDVKARLA